MAYTSNQLAVLAKVTPRTLHYYDSVGLLKPAYHERNGYRYYEEKELLKLQQILFFKELGFSLDRIKIILASPTFNVLEALKGQKNTLKIEARRISELIATIDKTIRKLKGTTTMTDEDLFEGFSDEEMKAYQEEARQKWGHTAAYKQSQERVKKMSKEDMRKIQEENEDVLTKMVAVMDKGVESPEVQAQVERHFQGINRFYDCSMEIYRGLGQMYVDDPRFTAYYQKFHPQLPEFLNQAITVYCNRKEGK
jgi:DNA-binding transcriptional MerR regulator